MRVAADAMRRRSLDIGCNYRAIITARMANTQSAKKRVRASARKRNRNRATRSAVKTLVSRARRPGEAGGLTSDEVRRAISALDKAAEKGVLHPNNASRRKSRLMATVAKMQPATAAQGKNAARGAASTGKAGAKTKSR